MNHSNRVAAEEAAYIENIIGRFSTVKHIRDEDWGFASELTSCMPGFIASVFGHFADSALRHTESFNEEEIRWLITETLYASAKLLRTTGAEYKQVVSKVATKGGITQEGVDVFNEALPAVFDELFKRTTAKMRAAEEKLKLGWS